MRFGVLFCFLSFFFFFNLLLDDGVVRTAAVAPFRRKWSRGHLAMETLRFIFPYPTGSDGEDPQSLLASGSRRVNSTCVIHIRLAENTRRSFVNRRRRGSIFEW